MEIKYKVKFIDCYGLVEKYKVKFDDKDFYEKYIVKDVSQGLYPQYYNKEVCRVIDTGNGIIIKLKEQEINLDYAEAQYIAAGLYAVDAKQGNKVKVKSNV